MCGVGGIVRPEPSSPVDEQALLRIARAIRHRGPDGFGPLLTLTAPVWSRPGLRSSTSPTVGSPSRPIVEGAALVYNGEVYNFIEPRAELEAVGESFDTRSDTEVVLRLLEREGLDGLPLPQRPVRARLVARRQAPADPGPRPLRRPAAALLAARRRDAGLRLGGKGPVRVRRARRGAHLAGIDDVFTSGPRAPQTAFAGVRQVPPGGLVVWERGEIVAERRWWIPTTVRASLPEGDLEELMRDSVRLRLRADVPVGTYLSGGLDSSLITALAQAETEGELRTFLGLPRPALRRERLPAGGRRGDRDPSSRRPRRNRRDHRRLRRGRPPRRGAAGAHRTGAAYLLARQVREAGITVIATGEGADELFWGYDLFKEVALRWLNA